ncbi:10097_t:CDS:1, partial [Ambispora leptoticha]
CRLVNLTSMDKPVVAFLLSHRVAGDYFTPVFLLSGSSPCHRLLFIPHRWLLCEVVQW